VQQAQIEERAALCANRGPMDFHSDLLKARDDADAVGKMVVHLFGKGHVSGHSRTPWRASSAHML
jgi:hypothetical protein